MRAVAALPTLRVLEGLPRTFAANDGLKGEERVREGEVAWLVGGDETRLISVMDVGAAAELSMWEVTAEEVAEGGQVAAPGVANSVRSDADVFAALCVQGADIGRWL